jgi:hypothetical protein
MKRLAGRSRAPPAATDEPDLKRVLITFGQETPWQDRWSSQNAADES